MDHGLAVSWRPHDDPLSPVRIDPERRFGRPSVNGISTDVLWEQLEAGVEPAEVAADFDLSEADVRWAQAYEIGARTAVA